LRNAKVTLSVVAGAGAALAFGVSTLCSATASRAIGAGSTVGWVALTGLLITLPVLAFSDAPANLDATAVGWLALSGTGNALGLLSAYRAVRQAKVAVVAPILSTEGAVAAVLAVLGGQALSAPAAAALVVITIGVAMAALARSHSASGRSRSAGVPWAIAGATAFGASLFATGRAGAVLPLAWAVLPPRLVGAVAVTAPLALAGRLRISRATAPLLAAAGACEFGGFALYTVGAGRDIAVTAVLVSLFGAVAALLARFVFSERLSPTQLAGVATIVGGVAVLSLAGS
jgi:drug/metabolite transporter (DMT)-like permease